YGSTPCKPEFGLPGTFSRTAKSLRRLFRKQASQNVALPHPQSCKHHDRKEDEPRRPRIVGKLFKWAVDITDDRNSEDDVNPAKNHSCCALIHRFLSL